MTARRPLCAICSRHPRAEGSARCADCGPGRIETPPGTHDKAMADEHPARASHTTTEKENHKPMTVDLRPVRDLITAAVAALDPQDRAERIQHCRRTGQHGVRLHVEPDDADLLEFRWGGRRLAMIRAADLFGDGPIAAQFVPDTTPDTVPAEWSQQ